MLTAVVGINWGDEGKVPNGRPFSARNTRLSSDTRAETTPGHTVVNDRGKFILNLLPSGILSPDTVNCYGAGHGNRPGASDKSRLRPSADKGIEITPRNLKISDRATICMPYHKLQDGLEEDRLGDKKYGSTRRGIAPVYADKYMKKTLRMGQLLYPEYMRQQLESIVEWKNLTLQKGYRP